MVFIEKLEIFDNSLEDKPVHFKNAKVLLKAARLGFLMEAVKTKLQLSLEELLLLKEFFQDELKDNPLNETIKSLLAERLPQANLDELFSMYSGEDSLFNEKLKPYLAEEIETYSLEDTIWGLERNLEKNKFIDDLVEPILQIKVNKVSLDELLEARPYVNSLLPRKHRETFKDLTQKALADNVQHIVDRFRDSETYRTAEANALLLNDVFDYLSDTQWVAILEGFCNNRQIYDSSGCPGIFSHLLEKSVKASGFVQAYWLSFREKLNELGNVYPRINELKVSIDSYLDSDF
jgi:hypothetical protein